MTNAHTKPQVSPTMIERRIQRLKDALACIQRCECAVNRREITTREAGDLMRCSDYRLSIVLWYSAVGHDTAGMIEMDKHYYRSVIVPLRHSICHVLDDVRTREHRQELELPANPFYRRVHVRTIETTEYTQSGAAVKRSVTPPDLIEYGIADAMKRLEARYVIALASLCMAKAKSTSGRIKAPGEAQSGRRQSSNQPTRG